MMVITAIGIMPAHATTVPTVTALIDILLAAIAFNAAWTINLDGLAGKLTIQRSRRTPLALCLRQRGAIMLNNSSAH